MRDFHIKAQVREGDREGRERKEKRECEGERMGRRREARREARGGGGDDETDIHSKRVLALVIMSLFCAAQFSLCVSVLSVSI